MVYIAAAKNIYYRPYKLVVIQTKNLNRFAALQGGFFCAKF